MADRLSKAEWQARQDMIRRAGGFKAYTAKQSSLTKQIDAALKANAPAPPKAGHNSRHRPPMVWDGDSACFSDLRYSPSAGGVYATFTDGSSYFYPMSRSDARSWFDSDVGRTFNAEIR